MPKALQWTTFCPNSGSAVTSAAVNGAIDTILITDSGSNYDAGTYYTPIKGDGSAGIAKLVVDSGSIVEASLQAAGTGYTYASINFGDVYSDSGLTTGSDICLLYTSDAADE